VLLADGLTRGQLRAAAAAGTLVRVRHGYLAVADRPGAAAATLVERARATLDRLGGDGVVGAQYAAELLHLPSVRPGRSVPRAVTVIAPSSGWRSREVQVHEGLVAPQDRVVVQGVVCTSVARTALDLARGRPLSESLVVLDAALRTLVLSDPTARPGEAWELAADPDLGARARAELAATYGRLSPRRLPRSLRAAMELADPRSESPLESASRGHLLLASLPVPDLQVRVRGDDGRWYRSDFGWREHGVLGEADGLLKYSDPRVLWEEKRRQEAILGTGEWQSMIHWTSEDVWHYPARLLARLGRALGG
jgi:hypothetical protein